MECPPGQVLRFGFTRKFKQSKQSKKFSRLTRKRCVPGIGKLKQGQLAKFGYLDVVHKTTETRHAALDKAVKEFGALSVFRKLNAVYVYTRKSAKESSKIFKEDRDWIKSKYM
jgi:pyoverdine/dityrosine biosynthesis protein Dit1